MKNIHIIKTDKPSRLALQLDWKHNYNLQLSKIADDWTFNWQKQNIYITSDEEIKEGDWFLFANKEVKKADRFSCNSLCKKIILTTDQNLIKDGVQEIDDNFLEWFVKNPSCEEVETKLIEEILSGFTFGMFGNDEPPTELVYKIIIPKEEPKQDALNHFLSTSNVIVKDPQISNFNKQETLEEVAERFEFTNGVYGFKQGAKWQQERMYSEEEVLHILDTLWDRLDIWYNRGMECDDTEFNLKKWFNECELKKK
jgi:hypothetical protein